LDHDFHVHSIVPSVALFVMMFMENFRGSVVVTSKDKVTQPSDSFRHAIELAAIVVAYTALIMSLVISLFL